MCVSTRLVYSKESVSTEFVSSTCGTRACLMVDVFGCCGGGGGDLFKLMTGLATFNVRYS